MGNVWTMRSYVWWALDINQKDILKITHSPSKKPSLKQTISEKRKGTRKLFCLLKIFSFEGCSWKLYISPKTLFLISLLHVVVVMALWIFIVLRYTGCLLWMVIHLAEVSTSIGMPTLFINMKTLHSQHTMRPHVSDFLCCFSEWTFKPQFFQTSLFQLCC